MAGRLLIEAAPLYLPWGWAETHENDALADWKAARMFPWGQSPFGPEGLKVVNNDTFGHPPTTPFLFLPLAAFEKPLVGELLGLGACALVAIQMLFCCRILRFPVPWATATLGTAYILDTSWMVDHFHIVQLSVYISFAYVLGWYFLRRRQDVSAGITLGIAVTIKLFPGLVILFFLLARKWKAFFAAVVTFSAIAGYMAKVYTLQDWRLYFAQQSGIAERWMGSVRNSSLTGILARAMTPLCEGNAGPSTLMTRILAATTALMLGVSIYLSWKLLRLANRHQPHAIDLPYTLFCLLSVFLNAWSWEHYFILIIHPLMLLAVTIARLWNGTFREWCDEKLTHAAFAVRSASVLAALALLVWAVYLTSIDMVLKMILQGRYYSSPTPLHHWQLHYYEVAAYLPWLIAILVCMATMPFVLKSEQRS
jgi:hypothetical protein